MRRRALQALPIVVIAVAAVLRLWALDRPATLVFDELYYVRDAISQLAHGFPTVWADDDPDMSGARATAFSAEAANAVHPPLGKWLIGLGILVFGPESGWGWRSAAAVFGVLTVAVTMRLAWRITRSHTVTNTAGAALALDGVHVTLSRVGLLDGFLTFFVALGALLVWRDLESVAAARRRGSASVIFWRRPWLVAAAAAFGCAAAVKWSGLYPLAAFLIFITLRDLQVRLRESRGSAPQQRGRRSTLRPVLESAGQAVVTACIALPISLAVYVTSWAGWILRPGGWGRTAGDPWPLALLRYHGEMLQWHTTLSAPHPYQASPWSWPLALRPTAMYEAHWTRTDGCPWGECVAAVSPLPNLLITWGGVVALIVLACFLVVPGLRRTLPRGGALASAFTLTGFLSGWLPWILTVSRSAVFQFYAVVLTPFAALGLALGVALWLGRLPGSVPRRDSRVGVAAVIAALTVCVSLLFFPLWSGTPIAEWFWRSHLWLPGWD